MTFRAPMDARSPSTRVRIAAGEIFAMLGEGPVTAYDVEVKLGYENRTVKRAITHIRTWDVGLKEERGASKKRGSRPMVYTLEDPCVVMSARAAVTQRDIALPISALAATAMAMDEGML